MVTESYKSLNIIRYAFEKNNVSEEDLAILTALFQKYRIAETTSRLDKVLNGIAWHDSHTDDDILDRYKYGMSVLRAERACNGKCGTCCFGEREDFEDIRCRRYPETKMCRQKHWCGEYKPAF